MINQLIAKQGHKIGDLGDIVYTSEPLVSGYFLCYIKLPKVLNAIISNTYEMESLLIRNIRRCDVPSSSLQYEIREHGKGLRSHMPTGEDVSDEVSMTIYEERDYSIIETLSLWYSCIFNPATYRPLVRKPFGESWQSMIKTTITIFSLPHNFLANPDNLIIYKLYGASISTINYADNQLDSDTNDLVQWNITFKHDRFVPLTKNTASLYGMQSVFTNSVQFLMKTFNDLQTYAYRDLLKAFDDIIQRSKSI